VSASVAALMAAAVSTALGAVVRSAASSLSSLLSLSESVCGAWNAGKALVVSLVVSVCLMPGTRRQFLWAVCGAFMLPGEVLREHLRVLLFLSGF